MKAKKRKRGKLFLQTGLTGKQWKELRRRVIAHNPRCFICGAVGHGGPSKKLEDGTTLRRLYLDHDHKNGRVRGLLCFRDNHRLLGRGLESAELHRRAARYLDGTWDARVLLRNP